MNALPTTDNSRPLSRKKQNKLDFFSSVDMFRAKTVSPRMARILSAYQGQMDSLIQQEFDEECAERMAFLSSSSRQQLQYKNAVVDSIYVDLGVESGPFKHLTSQTPLFPILTLSKLTCLSFFLSLVHTHTHIFKHPDLLLR